MVAAEAVAVTLVAAVAHTLAVADHVAVSVEHQEVALTAHQEAVLMEAAVQQLAAHMQVLHVVVAMQAEAMRAVPE